MTLVGIVVLIIVALAFDVDVGFVALSIAAVLSLLMPAASKDAVNKIAWPTVLLICGVVTYVSLLETLGSIDWMGEQVAQIGAPLLAALLICYVGGAVCAGGDGGCEGRAGRDTRRCGVRMVRGEDCGRRRRRGRAVRGGAAGHRRS